MQPQPNGGALRIRVSAAFIPTLRKELRDLRALADQREKVAPRANEKERQDDAQYDAALDLILGQLPSGDPPQVGLVIDVPRGPYGAQRLCDLLLHSTIESLEHNLRSGRSPGDRAHALALLGDCVRVIEQLEGR